MKFSSCYRRSKPMPLKIHHRPDEYRQTCCIIDYGVDKRPVDSCIFKYV